MKLSVYGDQRRCRALFERLCRKAVAMGHLRQPRAPAEPSDGSPCLPLQTLPFLPIWRCGACELRHQQIADNRQGVLSVEVDQQALYQPDPVEMHPMLFLLCYLLHLLDQDELKWVWVQWTDDDVSRNEYEMLMCAFAAVCGYLCPKDVCVQEWQGVVRTRLEVLRIILSPKPMPVPGQYAVLSASTKGVSAMSQMLHMKVYVCPSVYPRWLANMHLLSCALQEARGVDEQPADLDSTLQGRGWKIHPNPTTGEIVYVGNVRYFGEHAECQLVLFLLCARATIRMLRQPDGDVWQSLCKRLLDRAAYIAQRTPLRYWDRLGIAHDLDHELSLSELVQDELRIVLQRAKMPPKSRMPSASGDTGVDRALAETHTAASTRMWYPPEAPLPPLHKATGPLPCRVRPLREPDAKGSASDRMTSPHLEARELEALQGASYEVDDDDMPTLQGDLADTLGDSQGTTCSLVDADFDALDGVG